ncbi:MAG: hypothetical protein II901_04630 [Paludibacteraceae bacterium]|nr:hypothetical protein [Paludibacteraceae bacterium]
MKKLLLSAALLLCMCIGMNAQKVVVNNGAIGIDWKFKRSFLNGNTLVVDFVVENNTSKDVWCIVKPGLSANPVGSISLKAYDDEGNVYESNPLMGGAPFSGKIGGKNLFDGETIPVGNLIKVRLQINGIDEYATIIKTLVVPIITDPSSGGLNQTFSELRVTNIPIPRE